MKELRLSREEVAVWLGFALEKAIDLSPDEVASVLSDWLTLHDRLREAERAPTPEMVQAGLEAYLTDNVKDHSLQGRVSRIYLAMRAALKDSTP